MWTPVKGTDWGEVRGEIFRDIILHLSIAIATDKPIFVFTKPFFSNQWREELKESRIEHNDWKVFVVKAAVALHGHPSCRLDAIWGHNIFVSPILLLLLPYDQRLLARLDSRKPSILHILNQEMYHKIMKERFSIRVLDVVNLAVMYKNEMDGISILSHNYLFNRERS